MNPQQLSESVAESVFGDREVLLLGYKEIPTPSSTVFRLEYGLNGGHRVLFAKLPAQGKTQFSIAVERLRREFRLAQSVRPALGSDPELDTVSAAGYIEKLNCLVTREVKGVSLQNLLSSELRFLYQKVTPRLLRLSSLAGEWLRQFHTLDLIEGEVDLGQIILRYCEDRLEVLSRREDSQIDTKLADALMQDIASWTEAALSSSNLRTLMCHNDYSPHNIIVTEKGICVLDFSFATPGLPAFDLACFWHKLEDLKGSWLRANAGLTRVQEDFLAAYGSQFDSTRPEIKIALARIILSKMITILDSSPSNIVGNLEKHHRYESYLSILKSGFELPKK